MNLYMKKIAAASAAAALLVSMAGCSGDSTKEDASSTDGTAENILIGISPDYPPYESKETDGSIVGFDADMTQWIFDYLNENGHNYTYEFVELSFDNIITALQAGQVDLGISGFTYDAEREGIFSDSYYDSAQVIVVRSDSDITGEADLNGKLVGAQQGATGETAAKSIEGAYTSIVSDVKLMMETLKADGLDAVVIDKAVADNYAATGDFKIVGDALMDEENIIYTTQDNQELLDQINEAIAAFKQSDDYTVMTEKWFSTNE